MRNLEKQELIRIIKRIPADRIRLFSVANLHKRFAPEYTYATFRNYLKIFGKNPENIIKEKEESETNLGEKCATWNCDGKVIRDNREPKHSAICDKCGRGYWIVKRKQEVLGTQFVRNR